MFGGKELHCREASMRAGRYSLITTYHIALFYPIYITRVAVTTSGKGDESRILTCFFSIASPSLQRRCSGMTLQEQQFLMCCVMAM